jgi:hypothetical protein
MIAKRIPHKTECGHAQTPYARRKCRAAKLAAIAAEEAKTVKKPRYEVRQGSRPGVWEVIDTQTGQTVMRERDEQMIRRYAEARNTTPQTTTTPPSIAPAPAAEPAPRTGWSKAARRRAGEPVDTVGQMLGKAKPGPYTTCHYCGLNPRACDCH